MKARLDWRKACLPLALGLLLNFAPVAAFGEESANPTPPPASDAEKAQAPAQQKALENPAPAATPTPAPKAATESKEKPAWRINLRAAEDYLLRISPDPEEKDQKLRLRFDLGAVNPSDLFGVDIAFAMWFDLDSQPSPGKAHIFSSAYDDERNIQIDVYRLSVDYHGHEVVKLARFGRQESLFGPKTVFDGATFHLRPVSPYFDLYVFGGRTAHFFELKQGLFEDWLASGGVVIRPIKELRLELDYRFAREDTALHFSPSSYAKHDAVTDHAFGFTLAYHYEDWFYMKAMARTINKDLAQAGGDIRVQWAAEELGLDLKIKAQPSTLDELTEANDPLESILGKSLPNLRFGAELWKSFSTKVGIYSLRLGYQGRQLLYDDEEAFNRNFGRVYFLASMTDIGVKGPFLSLLFERWMDDPSPDSTGVWTGGGSLGYDAGFLKAEVGSAYARYKYSFYREAEEKVNVRSVFAEIKGKPLSWLIVRARYEFERFDRDVHTLLIGLGQVY